MGLTAKIIMKLLNYAMKNWQDNITFVLVEPKEPGNIGASARAIKNMGFRNLCLVNPPSRLTDEARWLACNALDVLDTAQYYPDVKRAIRGSVAVVGTSRRTGKHRGVILPVEQGAKSILERAQAGNVAILFGREDRGLLNEEVDECGMLLTIPTSREHRSLNLAQAVLIVAYELLKAGYALTTKNRPEKPKGRFVPRNLESGEEGTPMVGHGAINGLYGRMADTLKLLDYIPRGDRDLEVKIMRNLKHFIARSGLTEWELNMLHGILSQIELKVKR